MREVDAASHFRELPAASGPAGEVELLVFCCGGSGVDGANLRDDDAYELVALPLPDADVAGGARGIDAGFVAGWSADVDRTRGLLWEPEGKGWAPRALPTPAGLSDCRADAIRLPWIAGHCRVASERSLGVAWRDDGDRWNVVALLGPGDQAVDVTVTAMSGDLVVGLVSSFASFRVDRPAAWRLPRDRSARQTRSRRTKWVAHGRGARHHRAASRTKLAALPVLPICKVTARKMLGGPRS